MDIKVKLLPVVMPNSIRYTTRGRRTTSDNVIEVKKLTKEEADEYGEVLKQAFIDHWKKKQI